LAALSLLLNGGGLGQVQDITEAYSTAFAGREQDLRSLITQLDQFAGHLDDQTSDIIASTESFNALVAQFAAQKPVMDTAIKTIPDALAVLSTQRENLTQAFDSFGQFNALVADSVDQTKQSIVTELNGIGPVLSSVADAGPAATRSLSLLSTFPFPKETIANWFRGDYANYDVIFDLTLSRIDNSFFTGTRFECDLTELELQWGRTIGQTPSPCTARNPLVAPYRLDQGP
jgi:phospholipid/cholesterol/gamma-HCH transport system substrate-binding protein